MLELLMPSPEIQSAFIAKSTPAPPPSAGLARPPAELIEGLGSDLLKYETTADNSTGGDKVDCNDV